MERERGYHTVNCPAMKVETGGRPNPRGSAATRMGRVAGGRAGGVFAASDTVFALCHGGGIRFCWWCFRGGGDGGRGVGAVEGGGRGGHGERRVGAGGCYDRVWKAAGDSEEEGIEFLMIYQKLNQN